MIITCEQCNARYLLASLLLGVSGRKVRCGVCSHEWYQEPVDEPYSRQSADEASFSDMVGHADSEPIPESVRPIPEGSNVPAMRGDDRASGKKSGALGGVLTALLLFGVLTASVFAMRTPLVQSWPPLALVFDMAGLPVAVPGEGLIFDQMSARAVTDENGKTALTLSGNIINLKARETTLPRIKARLIGAGDDAEETGPEWNVVIGRDKIEGEETVPFISVYDSLPDDIREVNIRFTLTH